MPLHGKIVVIKRSGADGTEFPLTAPCLFGRKPECDIRIQLPQVSKEHCRIELNENKEVILTNLSAVNPTLINGKVTKQLERLKHGDLITIIDRSFRFEYPPEPTPKKRKSAGKENSETLQVLQDHQPRESESESKTNEKETVSPFSELYQLTKQSLCTKSPWKPCDGEKLKTPLSRRESQKTCSRVPSAGAEECTPLQNKSSSKPSGCANATPKSTPKSAKRSLTTPEKSMPSVAVKEEYVAAVPQAVPDEAGSALQFPVQQSPVQQSGPSVASNGQTTPVSQKRARAVTPQKFTPLEAAQQILSQTAAEEEEPSLAEKREAPKARRSREAHGTPQSNQKARVTPPRRSGSCSLAAAGASSLGHSGEMAEVFQQGSHNTEKPVSLQRSSPRIKANRDIGMPCKMTAPSCGENEGGRPASGKKRRSGDIESDLHLPKLKRKRVSFGGQLSPELFDKRLPPNSPLRRGATPRRHSVSVLRQQQSLLRASFADLIEELPAGTRQPKNQKGCGHLGNRASNGASARSQTPSPAKKLPSAKAKSVSPGKPKSPQLKPERVHEKTEAEASLGKNVSSSDVKTPSARRRSSPKRASQTPSLASGTLTLHFASAVKKSPIPNFEGPPSDEMSILPDPKTPLAERELLPEQSKPLNTSFPRRSPVVRGRFSISRVESPPVVEHNTPAPDIGLAVPACVTPTIPVRRTSLKSSKKTPRSVRRSAVEAIRSRRSGASRASFKVFSVWADVVKFGAAKAQAEVASKKRVREKKPVKRTARGMPKTPVQKIKGHFSTGHVNSPVTIVVGRAHAKTVVPPGGTPKLVQNTAVLKRNLKMNEDLTGIAEMFSTPVNTKQKASNNSGHHCLRTPKDIPPLTECSVMSTPEESGEMLVSPLSVANTAKKSYNGEDQDSSLMCEGSHKQDNWQSSDVQALKQTSTNCTEKEVVENNVKSQMSKNRAVKNFDGVKRLKTPKQKNEPVEDMVGLKRLMRTPKQKNEPVEDMVGLKRLMRTPKQKNEPVEDMVGLKRLMRTPKQKNEPVEDMVGLKRLMRTPKQKNEPVEDMVGLKRLMRTPKQKGQPVENKYGITKLMKSPRQRRTVEVEDYTGLQELMLEVVEDSTPVVSSKRHGKSQPGTVSSKHVQLTSSSTDNAYEAEVVSHKKPDEGSPEMPTTDDSAGAADLSAPALVTPDVKPKKRGRQLCQGEAVTVVTAAVPVKATRARRAKPMVETAGGEVDGSVGERKLEEPKKNEHVTHTEWASVETTGKATRGRRAAAPTKVSPPVRRAGRRPARQAESAEAVPRSPIQVMETEDRKPVSSLPVTRAGRGRKVTAAVGSGAVAPVQDCAKPEVCAREAECEAVNGTTEAVKLSTPAPKLSRGRKTKAEARGAEQPVPVGPPAKRIRRGASDLTMVTSKTNQGGGAAAKSEGAGGDLVVPPEASHTAAKTTSVPKTRGSRRRGQVVSCGTADDDVSAAAPLKEGSSVGTEVLFTGPAVETQKNLAKRGKAASREQDTESSDKLEVKEEAKVKRATKKTVRWISRPSDGTLQGCKKEPDVAETAVVPTEPTVEPLGKPRRGRAQKKSSEVPERSAEVTQGAKVLEETVPPLCRSRAAAQPRASTSVAPKRVPKRKMTADEESVQCPRGGDSAKSSSRGTTRRMARGKAARVEEEPAKMEGKALSAAIADDAKPAGRGRRRVVQQPEPQPKVQRKHTSKASAKTEVSDEDDTKATRARTKSEKTEAAAVAEGRPVRSTRRR